MRLPRFHSLVAGAAGALALLVPAGAAAAVPAPAVKAPAIGVSLPSYHYDAGAVTAYERALGRDVSIVQTFISWQYDGQPGLSEFPASRAKAIAATGASLEVTWVPSNPARGINDPAFSLASIARGDHDAYITRFAKAVKKYGQPVRIRFGHEMNGSWTPYSELRSGNSAGQFAAAWRHVHDVVEGAGATNTTWVWSPNILHPGGTDLAGLYPGDAYVDEVGIDGYSYPKASCLSPSRLFDPTLTAVRAITSKPVRLAEVGVATTCPNRAGFAGQVSTWAAGSGVIGWTWWERTGNGMDFRIVGTPSFDNYRSSLPPR